MSLVEKLTRERCQQMSGEFLAVVTFLLDQDWVSPKIDSLTVNNRQELVSNDRVIMSITEFNADLVEILKFEGLTSAERDDLQERMQAKIRVEA